MCYIDGMRTLTTYCCYPECGKPFTYAEADSGKTYTCPHCNGTLVLAKLPSFLSKAWPAICQWLSERWTDLCLTMKDVWTKGLVPLFNCICQFLSDFFLIYFDTKALKPDKSSPYHVVIGFIGLVYRIWALIWLMVGLVGILQQFHYLRDISLVNGFNPVGLMLGWIGVWLLTYLGYKLARVIFDIAEYLRQINNKRP